ncbi:RING-H2 finger protein ATL56-like isoform X2 [Dioscorea cayenensis subsp. rotundata]|uniref:RING-H2 finger protein ATL56-like isoform X2 n=1 Tax=Dioscorea cayennensis subsp. rotundata TaxID=55577 RepID=A0AB40B7S1_DIOCR|nr:RING-H2 finger protein ATL56-like isoform X2 [Dioscorea cayenensis subsp. rotundata]
MHPIIFLTQILILASVLAGFYVVIAGPLSGITPDGYDTPAHFHARKLLSPDIEVQSGSLKGINKDGHQNWWTQFTNFFIKKIFLSALLFWFAFGLFCILIVIVIALVCYHIFHTYSRRHARDIELIPISSHRGVGDIEEAGQAECIICIEPYHGGDDTRTLSCGHVFHASCITEWLTRSTICPLCRRVP